MGQGGADPEPRNERDDQYSISLNRFLEQDTPLVNTEAENMSMNAIHLFYHFFLDKKIFFSLILMNLVITLQTLFGTVNIHYVKSYYINFIIYT